MRFKLCQWVAYFLSIFVLITKATSILESEEQLDNLKRYEQTSYEEKIEELTEYLADYPVPEDAKSEILENFKSDVKIISRNDDLMRNNTFRIAILEVYIATKSFIELDQLVDQNDEIDQDLVEARMDEIGEYIKTMNIHDEKFKNLILNYFNESLHWKRSETFVNSENPYTLSFEKIYLPVNTLELQYKSISRKRKLDKVKKILVYKKVNQNEQLMILELYNQIFDHADKIKWKSYGVDTGLGEVEEGKIEDKVMRAVSIMVRINMIVHDQELNNYKKMEKLRKYAETLNSTKTTANSSSLLPEEMDHFNNYFNLSLTVSKTMLDDVFNSPILRKKILSFFIAEASGNFSEFTFFNRTVPTALRMESESLKDVVNDVFINLTPSEVDLLKLYFELYIEYDYIFDGVINKPYMKFCQTYNYVGEMKLLINKTDFSRSHKIDAIKSHFRFKTWVDPEEMELIVKWYNNIIQKVDKENTKKRLEFTEKIGETTLDHSPIEFTEDPTMSNSDEYEDDDSMELD